MDWRKLLEAIGLDSRTVLKRLSEGKPPYDNAKAKGIRSQKAYIKYRKNKEPTKGGKPEEKPRQVYQKEIELKEMERIILKGETKKGGINFK